MSAESSAKLIAHEPSGDHEYPASCSRSNSVDRYSGFQTYSGTDSGDDQDSLTESRKLLNLANDCTRETPLALYLSALHGYYNSEAHKEISFSGSGGSWTATVNWLDLPDSQSTVSVDINAGTYSRHDYFKFPHGDGTYAEDIFDESLSITSTSMSYDSSQDLNSNYGREYIWTNHVSAKLGAPYTSDNVNSDCDELLAQWDLLDDTQYPWRTDGGIHSGPLVTRNERGITAPNVGFPLTNVGTDKHPNLQPPHDTSLPPWPSQPEGTILGAPLTTRGPNGEPYSNESYFNFYHLKYHLEQSGRGDPQGFISSYGDYSPYPNATQWTDELLARILPAGPFWAYGSEFDGSGGADGHGIHTPFRLKDPNITDTDSEWEQGGLGACLVKCKWAETIDPIAPLGKNFVFKQWDFNFRDFFESFWWCSGQWFRANLDLSCPAIGGCSPVRYNPLIIPPGQAWQGYYIGPGSWWISGMSCAPEHLNYDCCHPAVYVQPNSGTAAFLIHRPAIRKSSSISFGMVLMATKRLLRHSISRTGAIRSRRRPLTST
jgi:hypothetical protein